jgi:FkbM family methyltransferase
MTASSTLLTDSAATRFGEFLVRLREDVYPELPSAQHSSITRQMWDRVRGQMSLAPGARVLDVGCGQGLALELFRDAGLSAVGITIGEEDLDACRQRGFEVAEMDQSCLEYDAGTFGLVWCRHALEHSVAPYFTLSEFSRVLASGGYLYVEVPAPDTACHHELNPNHYSVLGQSAWLSLMERAGFQLLDGIRIDLSVPAGPDLYWGFLLRKGEAQRAATPVLPPIAATEAVQDVEIQFTAGEQSHTLSLRLDRNECSEGPMLAELAAGRFYEPEVSYFLTNVLEPGDTFIDVGGHVGYFSMLAAHIVGAEGHVYTFEPEAANARHIREHMALNGVANVELFEQAVGDEAGEATLHVNADNTGGHALWDVGEHPFNAESRRRQEVRTVPRGTLAELLEATAARRIRLVKIDVEGSELRVLKGAMLLLMARQVPYVICEINEFALQQMGATGQGMRAFMEACGYTCYRMETEAPFLIPFPPAEQFPAEHVYNVLFSSQPVVA